eukprot:440049-Prorocentrum_minimum.AAC.1
MHNVAGNGYKLFGRVLKPVNDELRKVRRVDVKGNNVDVKGNHVDVKGNSVDVKGNNVDVKGRRVDGKGNSVDVKGNDRASYSPPPESFRVSAPQQ